MDVSHELEFRDDPLGQTVEQGTFRVTFKDGSVRDVQIRTLPGRWYQAGGCYGGLDGWFHGDDKGEYYREHDRWNLEDPAVRKIARTLSDHVVEVRFDGQVGYGIVEYGVTKGFPKYQHVQVHPAP